MRAVRPVSFGCGRAAPVHALATRSLTGRIVLRLLELAQANPQRRERTLTVGSGRRRRGPGATPAAKPTPVWIALDPA